VTYNFKTVSAELMTSLVREIVDAAGIEIDAAGIAEVVRRGNGSPRDTLTALEGFGGDTEAATSDFVPKIAAAVADRDATAIVVTIAETINAGIGIPDFSRSLLEHWRNCLLSLQAPAALNLTGAALRQVESDAKALKTNKVMRLLNVTSEALSKMNSSTDTRLLLETTLLQVSLPETADTLDGIYDYLDDIMAAVKRLSKEVRNGVAVQQPSEWPPVSGDASPVAEEAHVEPETKPDVEPVEDDTDADHSESNDSDEPSAEEVSSDDSSADEDDAPDVNESGDDSDSSADDESDESDYESYDDDEEASALDSDDNDDNDDPQAEAEQEQDEPPVRDISQLFGDDDDDEVVDNDEPVIPVESDRDRKRRERREAREREERGEAEPEAADGPAPETSPVVPGDFHNDDDPNCDCTRCQDEVAEYEQRALKEVREREKREAEEKQSQPKLRLVPNEEPKVKPARGTKKKKTDRVWTQDECASAGELVDIIQHEIVDKQTGAYLQPEFVKESLRGDVLVLTVKPNSRRVPTDEVIEMIRSTVDNLWVSDIEIVV
jgi:DNA polymerase III gamma/tau subunit